MNIQIDQATAKMIADTIAERLLHVLLDGLASQPERKPTPSAASETAKAPFTLEGLLRNLKKTDPKPHYTTRFAAMKAAQLVAEGDREEAMRLVDEYFPTGDSQPNASNSAASQHDEPQDDSTPTKLDRDLENAKARVEAKRGRNEES